MASVLENIESKKSIKLSKISITVEEETKDKIDYISKISGISKQEYLKELFSRFVLKDINKSYNICKKREEKEVNMANILDENFVSPSSNNPTEY